MTIAEPIAFPPHVQLAPCDQDRRKITPDDVAGVGAWLLAELGELRNAEQAAEFAVEQHGADSPEAETCRRAVESRRNGYAFWLERHQLVRTRAYALTFA